MRNNEDRLDLIGVDKAETAWDVQVVEKLRAHDAQAFRSLIERLQQPVIAYLHRLVGDREVALDLAQDTFLQVFKEIGKTSQDLALDAWIYRIATNYALRHLNRRRLRQFVGLDSPSTPADFNRHLMVPGPEHQAEVRMLVEDVLAQLRPLDAACLQLHFGSGFTYEEMAHILSLTPEAIRKRVSRSVEKFRALYATSSRAG
jgi:RNA polymerase sigma-70 factor, ECF subfamily